MSKYDPDRMSLGAMRDYLIARNVDVGPLPTDAQKESHIEWLRQSVRDSLSATPAPRTAVEQPEYSIIESLGPKTSMRIAVRVLGRRTVGTRQQVQITPVAGEGACWVAAKRLLGPTFEPIQIPEDDGPAMQMRTTDEPEV